MELLLYSIIQNIVCVFGLFLFRELFSSRIIDKLEANDYYCLITFYLREYHFLPMVLNKNYCNSIIYYFINTSLFQFKKITISLITIFCEIQSSEMNDDNKLILNIFLAIIEIIML